MDWRCNHRQCADAGILPTLATERGSAARLTVPRGGNMRIQKSIPVAVLTALLGLSIACTKSSKPSDEAITQDVQTNLAADPDTKDSQVTVVAKEGKVTLTGKVKTPAARKKVEKIAQEEPGVGAVDDQTAVEPEAEQAAQPAPPPPPPPPQPIIVPTGTTL